MPRGAFDLYLRLASAIERQAREHAVPIVCVHESWRIDQVVADVEGWFAAEIDSGPRAKTAAELRTLLREANVSVEAQVRAYFARPWATEWPSVVRVRMRMRRTQL